MKSVTLLLIAFGLAACSRSDEEHARERARQTAEQLKRDSREAIQKTEIEARKAGRELSEGLQKTREKARRALDQPDPQESNGRR
jgi:hypothetical protein